jgi:uncharacterized protein (TIGR02453 family)
MITAIESEASLATANDRKVILNFLDELKQNNNKPWFEGHRQEYEVARKSFEVFIDILIDKFRISDNLEGLSAKDCMTRIYRDIRFSRDKSPYKTNLGAMINPGGWRSNRLGYYISIEPHAQSMTAGGLYDPTADQLNRFRQSIELDAAEFKELSSARDFVDVFGEVQGDRLKTAPKGYDRDHPELAILQLKQITIIHRYSDQEVVRDDFIDRVTQDCRIMKPFLNYLSDVAG